MTLRFRSFSIPFIALVVLASHTPLAAQTKYTFSQFANETVDFIKQPLSWDGGDYMKIGAIGVGGGLLMFADEPIRDGVMRSQQYALSAPIEFGRMYGELYSPIIIFSGFAVYSLITDDLATKKIAYEVGQASLYGGALNYLLKVAIGRARPILQNGTQNAGTYRPFGSLLNGDYHSFPGGHATVAFTLSTVLARNVEPTWLKVLIYVPAVLTATARVYQNWHWTSDCVVGAAFGYYVGTWVVDQHEKPAPGEKVHDQTLLQRVQFHPYFDGDAFGVGMSIQHL